MAEGALGGGSRSPSGEKKKSGGRKLKEATPSIGANPLSILAEAVNLKLAPPPWRYQNSSPKKKVSIRS